MRGRRSRCDSNYCREKKKKRGLKFLVGGGGKGKGRRGKRSVAAFEGQQPLAVSETSSNIRGGGEKKKKRGGKKGGRRASTTTPRLLKKRGGGGRKKGETTRSILKRKTAQLPASVHSNSTKREDRAQATRLGEGGKKKKKGHPFLCATIIRISSLMLTRERKKKKEESCLHCLFLL